MPRTGISSEALADREDEIARFITAREHVDRLQRLLDLLYRRHMLTAAYYHDARDSLDYIACMLLTGKKNTARLRNLATD